MRVLLALWIAVWTISPVAAQNNAAPTREQVLANLDAKAKEFKSLEATIERRFWDALGETEDKDSGKLYIQTTRNSPRIKLEITEPASRIAYALLENGRYQLYQRRPNTLMEGQIRNDDQLQMLLIGFGVPSATIQKTYDAGNPSNETIDGQPVTSITFQPKEKGSNTPSIRLWLNPKDWTPVKTELKERTQNTWTFTYKEKKLNATLGDSVFRINVPKDAIRSSR